MTKSTQQSNTATWFTITPCRKDFAQPLWEQTQALRISVQSKGGTVSTMETLLQIAQCAWLEQPSPSLSRVQGLLMTCLLVPAPSRGGEMVEATRSEALAVPQLAPG